MPQFDKVKMDLGNGKFFEAVNNSADNKYIQSASLNGKPWDKAWFSHADLISGGKLILQLGQKPTTNGDARLIMYHLQQME